MRFGLTGRQNFTGVEGEDITFLPGDMVLTPRDTVSRLGRIAARGRVDRIHASASGRPGLPDHDLLHADGAAGRDHAPLKQTANLLVSPFRQPGAATVGEQRHALEPFDTVAVPSENWVQYRNDATEPLILFIASDEPALRAMGLFHQWGRTAGGDTVELV